MPPKLAEKDVARILAKKSLMLLDRYTVLSDKLRIKCLKCKDVWYGMVGSYVASTRNTRCANCAGNKRLSLSQIISALKRINPALVIVSTLYRGGTGPLKVRCRSCRTEWTTEWTNLQQGKGCRKCKTNRKLTQEEAAQRIPESLGIELVSKYTGAENQVRVRCKNCKHKWWAFPTNLWRGHGCLSCLNGSRGEANVRSIIERLTGWKFRRTRPSWLKGRSTHPLELDGYNRRHKIAFEYQGEQHYSPVRGGKRSLRRIKKNDERKRAMCRRRGVLLIRVPYFKKDVESFLKGKLRDYGITSRP